VSIGSHLREERLGLILDQVKAHLACQKSIVLHTNTRSLLASERALTLHNMQKK
jgi:hypothetical protein